VEGDEMNAKDEAKSDVTDLLDYLNIAVNFRNHEFNIQMLRNVVFTGTQTVILGCYAATIQRYSLSALVIALFGIALSIIWWLYYRASLYWAWFWECRCREVNDKVVTTLGSGVNIFAEHPAGADEKAPPIKFGGRTIKYRGPVHNILMAVPIVFCFLWVGLAIAAGIALSHHGLIVPTGGTQPQLLPPNATIP
jgi:hypothetical protein